MSQPRPTRRTFLGATGTAGVAAGAAAVATGLGVPDVADAAAERRSRPRPTPVTPDAPMDGVDPGQQPQTSSTFFSTVFVEHAGTYAAPGSDGDLWPTCWADDDFVYTANGDGRGFSDEPFKDLVVNRISGRPETGLKGEKLAESEQVAKVWGDPDEYNRKPTGMVAVGGSLYLAVQDLHYGPNAFDDVPNASISRSDDHGKTWHTTDEAMFTDYRFTTIFFADFGKDSAHAKHALGPVDGRYVYAYGMDWNWRTSNTSPVPDPVDLYLARVPANSVQDRAKWTFFTGTDHRGRPQWSKHIERKAPVLHDPLRRFADTRPGKASSLTVVSQGGVLYHPVFDRYLYTSWTDGSFEFYEAPQPWGPWRRFHYHDAGLTEWYRSNDTLHTPKNAGYGTTIPSKWVSRDGRSMWMQSNWWTAPVPKPEDNYNFNLRKVRLEPFARSRPTNRPDRRANLARSGDGVTAIMTSVRDARYFYLNDGNRSKAEDSYDGTNKLFDHWGYTFASAYRMDRLVYSTGDSSDHGGWFEPYAGGIRVQVRQDFRWVDVEGLRISPDYPYDASAKRTTFTFRFDRTWGDGIRVLGQPGGTDHYTSITELEVYYDG